MNPSTPQVTPQADPYYGLLTDPPGEWSIVAYGKIKAVLIQGNDEFLRRAFNMLSSFGGGKTPDCVRPVEIKCHVVYHNLWMVPITHERLMRALERWFFCQLYSESTHLGPIDEDVLTSRAVDLTMRFYQHGIDHRLDFNLADAGLEPVS